MSDTTLISRFQAAVDAAKASAKDIAQDIRPSTDPLRLLEATVDHAAAAVALSLWQNAIALASISVDAREAVQTWVAAEKAQVLDEIASLAWKQNLLEAALVEAVRRQVVTTLGDIADATDMD